MPKQANPRTPEAKAFSDAVARRGMVLAELAAKLNLSPGNISQWISGHRPIPWDKAETVAHELGVAPTDISAAYRAHALRMDAGVRTDEREWPSIIGYKQAAGLGNEQEAQEWAELRRLKFRADSLAKKHLTPHALAVMDCTGDSMFPTLKDGDVILFDTSDTTPRNNMIYVLKVPGVGADAYNVKRCKMVKRTAIFVADNPDGDHGWSPREFNDPTYPIQVIGRVRWAAGWVK